MTEARRSIGAQRNPASEIAILAAARDLLSEAGMAGFTVDAVAKRAGAGKPTIYRWWPSRAALLAAVYERERASRLTEPATGALKEDLAEFCRTVLSAWRGSPAGEALRGILAEAQASEAARSILHERVSPTLARPLRGLLGEAALRREIEPADIDTLVDLVTGCLWQRLMFGQLDDDRAALERMARLVATGRGRR